MTKDVLKEEYVPVQKALVILERSEGSATLGYGQIL